MCGEREGIKGEHSGIWGTSPLARGAVQPGLAAPPRRPSLRGPGTGRHRAAAREIAAEALKEVYLQDGGRRAGQLEEVRFTDIEHLEFDL